MGIRTGGDTGGKAVGSTSVSLSGVAVKLSSDAHIFSGVNGISSAKSQSILVARDRSGVGERGPVDLPPFLRCIAFLYLF